MRFLVGIVLALFAAWSGYWFVGQRVIEGQIAAVLQGGLPAGLIVENSSFDVAGFPNRFDLTLDNPQVSDSSGWGWQAEFVQVFAMTWKPWHLIAALPPVQDITTPFGPAQLTTDRFQASLQVEPDAAAGLDEAILNLTAAKLATAFLPPISADNLVLAVKRVPTQGFAYRLGVQITELSPLMPVATGGNLAKAHLDAVIHTTAALDRNLSGPPDLTGIDLNALSLDWGNVTLTGSGRLVRISDGFAEGEIALKVTGWPDLAARLADFGLLRAEIAPTLQRALELIAQQQGNPEVLDLPLTFKSGRSYLGPLPLGQAPRLAQRQ